MKTYWTNKEAFENGLGEYLDSITKDRREFEGKGEFEAMIITKDNNVIEIYDNRNDETYKNLKKNILIQTGNVSDEVESKLKEMVGDQRPNAIF